MLGSSSQPPANDGDRVTKLRVLCYCFSSEPPTAALTSSSALLTPGAELALIAEFTSYSNTTFARMRSTALSYTMLDATQPFDVQLLQAVRDKDGTARYRLYGEPVAVDSTPAAAGLSKISEALSLLLHPRCAPPPPSRIAPIGRGGRLQVSESSRPSTTVLQEGSSANTNSADDVDSFVFVRVLAKEIPKASRVVLQCSKASFVESLAAPLDAKLQQMGLALPHVVDALHAQFFLFCIVGVGSGVVGRALEPLERVGHLVTAGSNVLSVYVRERYLPPTVSKNALSTGCTPEQARSRCFVEGVAWDDEVADAVPQRRSEDPPMRLIEEPPIAVEEAGHPITMRVQLDLPVLPLHDEEDVEGQLIPFSVEQPPKPLADAQQTVPNALEDEFAVVLSPTEDAIELELYEDHLLSDTSLFSLPFGYQTLFGHTPPSQYVAPHSDGLTVLETGGWGLQCESPIPWCPQCLDEPTRRLDEGIRCVLLPQQAEVTKQDWRHILDWMDGEHEGFLNSAGVKQSDTTPGDRRAVVDASTPSSAVGLQALFFSDFDWDDVETVCAPPHVAPHSGSGALNESANAGPTSESVGCDDLSPYLACFATEDRTSSMPSLAVGWPSLLQDIRNDATTPPLLREPPLVATAETTQRVLRSERQSEFFRQQALKPLMSQYKRLHEQRMQHESSNTEAKPRGPVAEAQPIRSTVLPSRLEPLQRAPQPTRAAEASRRYEETAQVYLMASPHSRPPRRKEGASPHPRAGTLSVPLRPLVRSVDASYGSRHGVLGGHLSEVAHGEADVFDFLSQTLQSIHGDAQAHSFSSERSTRSNLEMLRSSVVAEYTQRLLQERRDIDARAAELARMLQQVPQSQITKPNGSYVLPTPHAATHIPVPYSSEL